jgi:hypothetical protein
MPCLSISPGYGWSVPAHFLSLFLLLDSRNHQETEMTSEQRLPNVSLKAALSAEVDKKRFPKTLTMKGGRQE